MSRPNLGDTKVDKILSQFSQRYSNSSYISELILPPMKVKEKTGKFAKYGTENLRFYNDAMFRAPGNRANSVDYSVSQGNYICREVSLEKKVPWEFMDNQDDPYDAKRDAVATLMDNIWVNQERILAAYLTSTANLTQNTTLSGTSQWSDYANSDPLGDIETGINTIRTATGQIANTAAFSYAVMLKLKNHPDVREQVKYTNGGQLGNDAFIAFLKAHFKLENVYVGTAVYDSADEGQSASITDVWNKDFYLFYQNARPTLMQSTFGYTFFDLPRVVDGWTDIAYKSDFVRVSYSRDQNVMDAALAYLIKNCIA